MTDLEPASALAERILKECASLERDDLHRVCGLGCDYATLAPFEALAAEFKQAADDYDRLANDKNGTRIELMKSGMWEQAHRMLVAAMAQTDALEKLKVAVREPLERRIAELEREPTAVVEAARASGWADTPRMLSEFVAQQGARIASLEAQLDTELKARDGLVIVSLRAERSKLEDERDQARAGLGRWEELAAKHGVSPSSDDRMREGLAKRIASLEAQLDTELKAVRNVETEIRDLRAEYRLGHVRCKDGTDAAAVDLPRHLLDRIEAALTATAEPTAGEER